MNTRALSASRWTVLSGLWVAGIGFFVTRFTVTLAAYDDRTRFLLAGVIPLVLGLLLAAFGVALVVGSFEHRFVRTTAIWTTIGAVTMLGLTVLTLFGSNPDQTWTYGSVRSNTYLANFLIGGSVGGTLTGVYAALNKRYHLRLEQQANRLVVLNRILRDEMLNAVAVIRGTVEQVRSEEEEGEGDEDGDGEVRRTSDGTFDVIEQRSDRIVDAIEDVKYLTETVDSAGHDLTAVSLGTYVTDAVTEARDRFPEAEFTLHDEPPEVSVWANSRLSYVLENLLENAVVHNDSDVPRVGVEFDVGDAMACFRISDNGQGLPDDERATLERGEIEDLEDPSSGFGINLVRLLVEQYNGAIETTVTEEGSTIEVLLARADGRSPPVDNPVDVRSYGVELPDLGVAIGAALVAGGVMGVVIQAIAGVVPVIGALYGVKDPFVGWITHEFHSIVFGLVFAGLLAVAPARYATRLSGRVGIAAAWALFLCLFTAGLVMPTWLRLVGLPAPLPQISPASIAGHAVWGLTLGITYHAGVSWLGSRADD